MSLKNLLGMTRDFLDLRSCEALDPFIDGVDWQMIERNFAPAACPLSANLEQCVEHAGNGEAGLVRALVEHSSKLEWFSTNEGKASFVELAGPQGQFMSDEIRLGFFVQQPGAQYREHRQEAEELIVTLTSGGLWSKDGGEFFQRKSGEIMTHEGNEFHSVKSGEAPLLALWLWRGGDLQQTPEF